MDVSSLPDYFNCESCFRSRTLERGFVCMIKNALVVTPDFWQVQPNCFGKGANCANMCAVAEYAAKWVLLTPTLMLTLLN